MTRFESVELLPDCAGELRADWDPRRATVTGEPAVDHGPLEQLDESRVRFYRVWARGLIAEGVLAS